MKKFILSFIGLSILFSFIIYFTTSSWIVALMVFIFSVIFLLIFTLPICKRFSLTSKRFHQCYNFINNFIVSLSVKNTIEGSINTTIETMNESFKKDMEGLEHLSGVDKLTYISKYFPFDIYKLFLNIISLYEEQGGNILQMSSLLTEKSRYQEQYLNKTVSIAKRKIIEFSTLWLFSLAIIVVLRFVLGQFYTSIFSQLLFQILVGLLFVFVVISIHILVMRITKVEIKGWSNYEL